MIFSATGKKILFASIIFSGILFTSCSKENPENGNTQPGTDNPGTDNPDTDTGTETYRMSFKASEETSSRASVDEGTMNGGDGSTNSFRWDKNDEVMIWTGKDASNLTPCLFTTKDGGLNSATFEYEGKKVESNKYFGYYPYSDNLNYNNIEINVPADGSIVQKVKDSSVHIGPFRPMYTSVVNRNESSETLTGLNFRHITSLLYFRLRNKSGKSVNLEAVTVKADNYVFPTTATLSFNPDDEAAFSIVDESKSNFTTLSFGENKSGFVWNNEEITAGFLPVLPVDNLSGVKLSVIIKADGQEYTTLEINNAESFRQAHYYKFGLTLSESGISIDSYIPEWEPGEEIVIPV